LFIEVVNHKGQITEAVCGKHHCYFDLNELPGDPREPNPTFGLKRKGNDTGWSWESSANEVARQGRAYLAQLQADKSFRRFLSEAKQCLASSESPGCFAAFVKGRIYYPKAEIGDGYVTPEQFVAAVWSAADSGGGRPWTHLVDCFRLARGDSTRLESDQGWMCDLEKVDGVWKLVGFFQGD
jgi:hypothetical protein